MTIEQPLFLQGSTGYTATNVRRILGSLYPFPCVLASHHLAVTQTGGGGGAQSVTVAFGQAVVHDNTTNDVDTFSAYLLTNAAAAAVLSMPTAPVTNSRYDIVVATVRDASVSGSNNDWILQAVSGTEAGSPTVPATPDRSVLLAKVLRAVGDNTIATADITDQRQFGKSGGELYAIKLVAEDVTSSTTLQDDDALSVTFPNNDPSIGQVFKFEFDLIVTGATAGDFLVVPAVTNLNTLVFQPWGIQGYDTAVASATSGSYNSNAQTTLGATSAVGTAASVTLVTIRGTVQNGVVMPGGGRIYLRWAQNTSSGTATTVKAGSTLRVWRM